VGDLRLATAYLAALLVQLSIPPVRRSLPVLRSVPAGVRMLVWLGFVWVCLATFASVQTRRSTELGLATARVAIYFAGQAFDSLMASAHRWVTAHESVVVVVTVGIVLLSWLVIAARAVAAFRRAREPRPRLGGWWEVNPGPAHRAKAREPRPTEAAVFMDAHAVAQYLGVPSATIYRWARTGRLRSRRARGRLRFNSLDVEALRELDGSRKYSPPTSIAG